MNTIGIDHNLDRMMIIQFNAFSKGLTPYPRKARWFCVLIGMIPAMVLSAIVGPYSALGSAVGTMFLSFGNAFLFGGLLATLPEHLILWPVLFCPAVGFIAAGIGMLIR